MAPDSGKPKKTLLGGDSLASRGEETSSLRLGGSTPLSPQPFNVTAVGPTSFKSSGASTKTPKTINGTSKADTLVGGSGNQTLRGKGANDTLWGDRTDGSQGGSDTFVFEKSLAYNGLDTIKDYHWSADNSDGLGQDVLDLTAALKSFKYALKTNPNANITDYVRLEPGSGGMNLMVDTDGAGGKSAEQWAFLEGLTASDPVRVRAFTASGSGSGSGQNLGDGYYTLGGEAPLPDYITVGRDGMWFDANEDGQLNGDETLITALDDTDGDGYYKITDPLFTDFATGDYTVRFVDAITPKALDLTGFGAGDKIILDGKTNYSDYYGREADIKANTGNTSNFYGAPTSFSSVTNAGNNTGEVNAYFYTDLGGTTRYLYAAIDLGKDGFVRGSTSFSNGSTQFPNTYYTGNPAFLAKGALGTAFKVEVIPLV